MGSKTAAWRKVHAELAGRPLGDLDPAELGELADSLFWIDRVDESMDVRRRCYQAHAEVGDDAQAAMAAWRLFYDHFLVGETAIANGWIERCRHHVDESIGTVEAGWLHVALADVADSHGDQSARLTHAATATSIARRFQDGSLLAMALQAEGRALIDRDDHRRGVALLDEAMIGVTGGEVDPIYTGWVYCNVVSVCYQLADLDRAGQWCRAALRWCDTLSDGQLYPGLCRVYAVELDCLYGEWSRAEAMVTQACSELTAFDPRYAGDAFYLAGQLRRLRGDLEGAAEAFQRATELGRVPQPGLAFNLALQGRVVDAVAALRTALPTVGEWPLPRARLLIELITLELALSDIDAANGHLGELRRVADRSGAPVIDAMAQGASGRVSTAEGDHDAAYRRLHLAVEQLVRLNVPYEAARLQVAASRAADACGDRETARLEAAAARAVFVRLGADLDAAATTAVLDELRRSPRPRSDSALSAREREVLREVAAGYSNRQIADRLYISANTVGRHVSNIFAKLGVTSRAAATAYAYEHDLIDSTT